ncbi:thioredoxin [Coprobacillus sp. CAG:698]|nr:thioredoxin [Coprobacillus sp. CAG:698]
MLLELNYENYEKVVKENKIVLIDFYATWCGPCKMLSPIIEEIAEEGVEGVQICKVDVDKETKLASKFGIQSIPTLVVIKDAKPERMAMGYRPKESILRMLEF